MLFLASQRHYDFKTIDEFESLDELYVMNSEPDNYLFFQEAAGRRGPVPLHSSNRLKTDPGCKRKYNIHAVCYVCRVRRIVILYFVGE